MPIITAAHWHILLNHVPIIGVPLVALLLAWGLMRREEANIRAALYGTVLLAFATFVVDQTGDKAKADIRDQAWANRDLIHGHEEAADKALFAGITVGVLALGTLVLSRGGKPVRRDAALVVLAGLGATAVILAWTAWEGGKIRHSEFGLGAPTPVVTPSGS